MKYALPMLAVLVAFSAPAGAQSPNQQYKSYVDAVEAAKLCRDLPSDQMTEDKLSRAIAARMQGEVSAGDKLQIMTASRDQMKAAGCGSAAATEALARFDQELAGSL